ncbi:winged helix DNA-binding domain-containing protein [Actinomadura decatromicini]|uniref:Winged helix DNA-binding domain-containing protein n=1 Tax=Actinomadura decatromicini TaxID=2604572 RepID=A0A5D3FIM0_9ACTN|nr:winged helix DNA-binding domain-containing protein [Actinomadura decatromicini]TYK47812.1 winged helix DNA-binding domain-containing protein [Actinomadura decatromicini]
MRSMSDAERRARLGVRHRLSPATRTGDVLDAARSVVVLHATDPATVFLSVAARTAGVGPAAVERALYDDRTLLRMLAMRRTMFVVPTELVPVLQASTANALAVKQRTTYGRIIERGSDVADVPAFFAEAERAAHKALLARGEATGAQLSADAPILRTRVDPAPGKSYSRPTSVTTWVLVTLGCEGRIVRGRPNGTWASSQYRWSPVEAWLPGGIAEVPPAEARADLVRRWLRAFGPAPVTDLKWWTGWNAGDVKKALALLDVTEVDLGGGTGIVLSDDLEPTPPPEPWAALLPALDPTPMGWQERGWFLGGHGPRLFDRNGNIGPSVWWDGRIVGGWAQRPDGEIAVRLLDDVGADAEAAIGAEAARTAAFYGDVRAVPRFRTPLERELTS